MVLKMSKDKTLAITKSSNTYEGEHNAETIKIIVPKLINGNNTNKCLVWLNFINSDNLGRAIDITEFLQDYSDRYYSLEIPMDNIFTYKSGNIKIWLKILSEDGELIIKTNEVVKAIIPHIEVEDTLSEAEKSVLDSIVVKLDATSIQLGEVTAKVEDIDEYVGELQEGEVVLVQPMLTAKIQEQVLKCQFYLDFIT